MNKKFINTATIITFLKLPLLPFLFLTDGQSLDSDALIYKNYSDPSQEQISRFWDPSFTYIRPYLENNFHDKNYSRETILYAIARGENSTIFVNFNDYGFLQAIIYQTDEKVVEYKFYDSV